MGRSRQHAQHQTQRIDQQMALAPGDFLAGSLADLSAVTIGFDALTVHNGRGGTAALAFLFPRKGTEGVALIDSQV
jgi:hypothetical protein